MSGRVLIIGGIIAASLAVGTWRDRVPDVPRIAVAGYEVLAVDFHVHTHPLSSTTLAPWDVVSEARRARLDAIAVAPHDHIWTAQLARWFAMRAGGPMVIVSEENSAIRCDILAIGIRRTIPWGLAAADVVNQIHAQGGVAIAAHPTREWRGCDAAFDGSEVVHPIVFDSEESAEALRAFHARAPMAAIGDSDYHIGPVGVVRTYVFARQRSVEAILDAVRAKRTVVYDRGRVYGDPVLIDAAAADGRLPRMAREAEPKRLGTIDGAIGIAGLIAAAFFAFGAKDAERSAAGPR